MWTGTEWIPLKRYPDHSLLLTIPEPKSEVMTDGSGNTYTSHFYGQAEIDMDGTNPWSCNPELDPIIKREGLYWTDANIYATKTHDKVAIKTFVNPGYTESIVLGGDQESTEVVWRLDPGQDINALSTRTVKYEYNGDEVLMNGADFVKKFGIVYNSEDANRVCDESQGWRLPKYEDWQKLEKYYPPNGDFLGKQLRPAGMQSWAPRRDQQSSRKTWYSKGYDSSDPMYLGDKFNALPSGIVGFDKKAEPNPDNARLAALDFGLGFDLWMQDRVSSDTHAFC